MATSCLLTIEVDLRAVRRAAPKPARRAGRQVGAPVGGRPAYPLDEGQA